MPEARDRRVIPLDVDTLFRRPFSAVIQESEPLSVTPAPAPFTAGSDRFFTERTPVRREVARARRSPGSENTPPTTARRGRRGRATASRSVLPSWYPRTPLQDITAIVRAIERRRERQGTEEIEQTGTPVHANQLNIFSDPASFSAATGSSSRIHKKSPKSCIKLKTPYGSKVPKIIIDIAKLPAAEDGESELLTPQKKLLHSIDIIEREVKQELMKLKRTPTAKKAEHQKRVRTLMSMR